MRNLESRQERHPWLASKLVESRFKKNVSVMPKVEDVRIQLDRRLRHDEIALRFNDGTRPFLHVDYTQIAEKLPEIARFIGSSASEERVREIVDTPPTVKVPKMDMRRRLRNFDELSALGEEFEAKRVALHERFGIALPQPSE